MPELCDHRWSEPAPVWIFNQAGELVHHPTLLQRFCLNCAANQTVERKPS